MDPCMLYMLTWLGYIDGIHVTIYSIHGSHGIDPWLYDDIWGGPKNWSPKIIQHGWFSMVKTTSLYPSFRNPPSMPQTWPPRRKSDPSMKLWSLRSPAKVPIWCIGRAVLCQSLPLLILGIFNYLQHSSALSKGRASGSRVSVSATGAWVDISSAEFPRKK